VGRRERQMAGETIFTQLAHLEWVMNEKGLISHWNELKRVANAEADATNVTFEVAGGYTYYGDIPYASGGFATDVVPTIARTTPVGYTDSPLRAVPNGGRPPTQAE
jgi:hypothetical protein